MESKRNYELSSQTINAAQAAVVAVGLLGALSIGVYQVAAGGTEERSSIGKLTQLLVYWAQLQGKFDIYVHSTPGTDSNGRPAIVF